MAISKITLNGVTQIDLTSDTVTSQTLLDDVTAHGADGTLVTGSYVAPTARTASDVTVSGATVTIPAGAYSSQVQKSVANATYSAVVDNDFTTYGGQRKWVNTGWVAIESGGYIDTNEVISVVDTTYNAVPANTTITPTTSTQTIGGANYMMEGAVTVGAIPTGTAGTPTASKGTVSNHAVTVTPSVTNSTGYITGGTKTGTAVTVSASELVSGDKSITQNGSNIDVAEYSTVTVNVSGGGLDADYKAVLEGTATNPSFPSGLTKFKQYCFYNNPAITTVTMPNTVTNVESYAFQSCTGITSISFSTSLTTIGAYAFRYCIHLSAITLPSSLTSIGSYAFNGCTAMTSVTCNGTVSTFSNNSFSGTSSYPSGLVEARFPYCTATGFGTIFTGNSATTACTNLELVDCGLISNIYANAFAYCSKLQTLILRKTASICVLANTSAFTNTPFSGYNSLTGTVYVPNALISTYQTANNWSTLYNNGTVTFKKIEGSDYEL